MTSKWLLSILISGSLALAGNYISVKDITQIDVKPEECELLQAYTSKPLFGLKKIGNSVLIKLKKPVGQEVDWNIVPKYLDLSFITTCGTETRVFPVRDLPATTIELYLTRRSFPAKARQMEEEMADILKCYLEGCEAYPYRNGKVIGDTVEMEEVLYENRGKKEEVLSEAMFCRGNCIGVALEKHLVKPGEVVRVWIFRRR